MVLLHPLDECLFTRDGQRRSSVVLFFLLNDMTFVKIATVTSERPPVVLLEGLAPTKIKRTAQWQNALWTSCVLTHSPACLSVPHVGALQNWLDSFLCFFFSFRHSESCWKIPTTFCITANVVLKSLVFFYAIAVCCTIFSAPLYKTWGAAVGLYPLDMDMFVRIHLWSNLTITCLNTESRGSRNKQHKRHVIQKGVLLLKTQAFLHSVHLFLFWNIAYNLQF